MNRELIYRLMRDSELDNFVSPENKFLLRFAEMLVDECVDVVVGCDESPKAIVHEPYRTIMNEIRDQIG